MRRHLLGILSAVLLLTGITGVAIYGVGDGRSSMWASVCMRLGLLLGAIWLALPQLMQLSGRTSAFLLTALMVLGSIIAVRPRTVVVLGPLLLILAILYFLGQLLQGAKTK